VIYTTVIRLQELSRGFQLRPGHPALRRHPPPITPPQLASVAGSLAAVGGAAYYSSCDVQRRFELMSATGPLVRLLDPEVSHRAGILAARLGLFPKETRPDPEALRVSLWGRTFSNPLGS